MKIVLTFAAAFATVFAMAASADAKSAKRHGMKKDHYMRSAAGASGMQSQQNWGWNNNQSWGWNSNYVFKGDRYDYPTTPTRAPMSGKGRSAN
jgi:hypothetical protein